jgi:hypothetical protein
LLLHNDRRDEVLCCVFRECLLAFLFLLPGEVTAIVFVTIGASKIAFEANEGPREIAVGADEGLGSEKTPLTGAKEAKGKEGDGNGVRWGAEAERALLPCLVNAPTIGKTVFSAFSF